MENKTDAEELRLKKLLEYAKEAMEYWFSGCDNSDEELIKENQYFITECDYFIDKLK